jgi:hypothetical protein
LKEYPEICNTISNDKLGRSIVPPPNTDEKTFYKTRGFASG